MIDILSYKRELAKYKNNLVYKKYNLEQGKIANKEREELEIKYKEASSVLNQAKTLKEVNKRLLEKVIAEDIAFKERRLDFLSEKVTEYLQSLFPARGFRAKIECDFYRGDLNPRLRFFDKHGNERLLFLSEGRFLQSLISYGGSVALIESLGTDKLFMDEAFAVSDPENLLEVGKLTETILERMAQVFMIEQTSNGYKNIPRREIHLEFDEVTETVKEPVIIDY